MSAGTSPLFFLIVCFLFSSSDAQDKLTTELGKDVILPCKVPSKYNINNNIAVQWIRRDLDPDYVLFYRDGHKDPENQHPSYQNRVDLQDKDMKDGNFSLILKNVKMEDNGTYECRVFEKGNNEPISNIILEVRLSDQEIIRHENITANLGQDVILPCKVSNNNINIRAVEWIRRDLDPEHVLFYRDGHIDPDSQNPSYQNRVDLQDKDMKDGDVSLILKNVKMEDTGTYECYAAQGGSNRRKRSDPEPISIITLKVLLSGEKSEGGKDGRSNVRIIVGAVVGVILLLLAVLGSVGFRHMKNPHCRLVPLVDSLVPEMSRTELPTSSVLLMEPTAAEPPEM